MLGRGTSSKRGGEDSREDEHGEAEYLEVIGVPSIGEYAGGHASNEQREKL